MGLTWIEVAKKYIARHEVSNKRPSIGGVKRLIASEEDYLLCLRCSRGEIYRFDLEGKIWAISINSAKGGNKRRALWDKLNKMGCELFQCGDTEASWKFPVEKLDQVAELLKVKRVRTRKAKK